MAHTTPAPMHWPRAAVRSARVSGYGRDGSEPLLLLRRRSRLPTAPAPIRTLTRGAPEGRRPTSSETPMTLGLMRLPAMVLIPSGYTTCNIGAVERKPFPHVQVFE